MEAKSKIRKTESQVNRPDKVRERGEVKDFLRAVGISEPTFADYRKIPGAPVTLNIEEWRIFMQEQGLTTRGTPIRATPERELHLTEGVAKRNRLLELEIAQKEGRMADRGEVNEMLMQAGSLMKTILYAKMERELPGKAVGRSASEIAALGRETADELADIFSRALEEWRDAG